MVEAIVARSHGPLLVVATARPELAQARASWGQRPGTWQVALTPLDAQAARDLVADMLPGRRRDGRRARGRGRPRATRSTPRRSCATSSTAAAPSPRSRPRCARCSPRASMRCPRPSRTCSSTPRSSAAGSGPARWSRAGETSRWRRSCARSSAAASSWRGRRRRCPASASCAFVHGLTREVAYRSIPRGARCRVHAAVAALARGAGRRPPRRVPRRARPPLRGRGGAADAALAWPEGSPERRGAARGGRPHPGGGGRGRAPAPVAGPGPALRRPRAGAGRRRPPSASPPSSCARAATTPPSTATRRSTPISRRSSSPRALGDARGHRAPARVRDPAVQPLSGRRSSALSGRRTPTTSSTAAWPRRARTASTSRPPPCSSAARGGTWRWRDPIAEDLAARQARRRARGARSPRRSARRCCVSIALEALTWIAFSQGDCEARGPRRAPPPRGDDARRPLRGAREPQHGRHLLRARGALRPRRASSPREAARQAPGMSAHRALHAVASQAIALVARRGLRRAARRHARRGGADRARSASTSAPTPWWRWRRVPSCCTRAAQRAAAPAALELFDRVAPPDRPLVRWGPWIVEVLRAARRAGGDRGPARPTSRSRHGAGQRGRHPADRAPAAGAARRVGARRRAGGSDARAGRLEVRAGAGLRRRLGRRDAPGRRRSTTSGRSRSATAATAALAGRGETYTAARLMTDLLARLGDAAPRDLVDADGASAWKRWERTPAPPPPASLAYARDAGA